MRTPRKYFQLGSEYLSNETTTQTVLCPVDGIQEIIKLDSNNRHIVNRDPPAFAVTAKLACAHSIRVVMSPKNMELIERANT